MNAELSKTTSERGWSRSVVNRLQLLLLPALVCYLLAIVLMRFTPVLIAVIAASCAAFLGLLIYTGIRNRSYRVMTFLMIKFVVMVGCSTLIWIV